MNQKPKRALWTTTVGSLKPNGFSKEKKERNRIRPRSKAYEKKMRQYRKQREDFLKRNPRCEVYPELRATQCHHRKGRGRFLLDEITWMAVSMEAHRMIHDNPAWAYANGYLERRG